MAGSGYDNLTYEQKLRLALQKDVKEVCKEAAKILDLVFHDHAFHLISELAWKRLKGYGEDIEVFAKHAKRSTINMDDVKLLVRKNNCLKLHVATLADSLPSSNNRDCKKRKTTNTLPTASASVIALPGPPTPPPPAAPPAAPMAALMAAPAVPTSVAANNETKEKDEKAKTDKKTNGVKEIDENSEEPTIDLT